MQIEVNIDKNYKEPKIAIYTAEMSEEINELLKRISQTQMRIIVGFADDKTNIIEQEDIIRIYSSSGKIIATTTNGEYIIRLRLYELEERLDPKMFIRISNSEIINLKKVKNFDLNFVGTICVALSGDITTYVSRRYVSKIKKTLGI